jgi:hypothetical protein
MPTKKKRTTVVRTPLPRPFRVPRAIEPDVRRALDALSGVLDRGGRLTVVATGDTLTVEVTGPASALPQANAGVVE